MDYVNPLIGSPFAGFAKGLEGGGTTPIVGLPYSMTNFVLQTHENKMSRTPYIFEDSTVNGFIATPSANCLDGRLWICVRDVTGWRIESASQKIVHCLSLIKQKYQNHIIILFYYKVEKKKQ